MKQTGTSGTINIRVLDKEGEKFDLFIEPSHNIGEFENIKNRSKTRQSINFDLCTKSRSLLKSNGINLNRHVEEVSDKYSTLFYSTDLRDISKMNNKFDFEIGKFNIVTFCEYYDYQNVLENYLNQMYEINEELKNRYDSLQLIPQCNHTH